MKLNADLIFDRLPKGLNAKMTGVKSLDLALGRPLLCEGQESSLAPNRLHIMRRDSIPAKAAATKGCVIVCMGDSPRLERFRRHCSVITVDPDTDFYQLFNYLQGIFDFYDKWESDIRRVVEQNGSITELLNCAEPAFENPLYAIDADFRLLGASNSISVLQDIAELQPMERGSLKLDAFDSFLRLHEPSMEEREPIVLSLLDQTTLCCNLFNGEEYAGCVVAQYSCRPYRPSDKPLIAHLGALLQFAMRQLAAFEPDGPGTLLNALQGLVEGRPLDSLERGSVSRVNNGDRFVCMRMKLSNQMEQLPLGYVRNAVESAFPLCFAFEFHRNSVVALVDIDVLPESDYLSCISKATSPFTGSMQMKAGVSQPHNDLVDSRFLFRQANAALDLGVLFNPAGQVYGYAAYELHDMIINAVGDTRLELLFPEGLQRLIDHDRASSASYVDTLGTLLENNMSVSKTASQLFLHRSTLNERIDRIKREIGMDLEDPDVQLQLRILIKAVKTRRELRSAKDGKA